jgi:site-specific DNA recombinase
MSKPKIKWRSGNAGITYLRVSSRGQVETEIDPEGMSLPAQRRKCHDKAVEQQLRLIDELVDAGVSGTTIDQRKSYQELIERVRTDPTLAFVMVYSLSRLHRNWAEAGLMLMQLHSYGVRLLSATENIDDRTPEGRMMLAVIFGASGYQSEASSKDLQYKMTQKALVGGTPGWVPIGYVNTAEQYEGRKVNTVGLDPERAPFIPLAFEWFSTGQYTYAELRDKLTEAGLLSRPNRLYPARPLSINAVQAMLRNRYYLGYVTFSAVEYQGRHQPLVTQEEFDRVQDVLRMMPGAGTRTRRYNHYLKGLVWCDRCKRRLIVMRGKSKTGELYFYYVCRGHQDRVCDLPYVRASHVEKAVAQHYRAISLPPLFRERLAELFDEAADTRSGQAAHERTQLRRRLTELESQEDRYVDLVIDPDWPKDKITEKLRAIRDERARIEARLARGSEQLKSGQITARRVLEYLEQPYELYERSGVRNRTKLNRLLFNKLWIDVMDDQVAGVTADDLHEPFATVVYLRREFATLRPGNGEDLLSHWFEEGDTPDGSAAFRSRVLSLLKPLDTDSGTQGSSISTLAEDRGFEPLRDLSQHDFQSCALGH